MNARCLSHISLFALTTCFLMNACVSASAPGKNAQPNSSADPTEKSPAAELQPTEASPPETEFAQAPQGAGAARTAPADEAATDKVQSQPGLQQSSPLPTAKKSATGTSGYPAANAMPDQPVASDVSRARGETRAATPLRRDLARPGLATQWGETRSSWVTTTSFNRDDNQPWSVLRVQYDDEAGILARTGRHGYSELLTNLAETSNGFVSVQLVDEGGSPLAGLTQGSRTFVVGRSGDRYSIRVTNHSSERFEILATVDGLDVIDSRAGSYGKRGYLVDAYANLDIDGFRRSSDAVAAFRFGSVRDSYAARTGSDRNVGVIGIAIFRERDIASWRRSEENRRRDNADPFPNRYSTPPPPVPMIRN